MRTLCFVAVQDHVNSDKHIRKVSQNSRKVSQNSKTYKYIFQDIYFLMGMICLREEEGEGGREERKQRGRKGKERGGKGMGL